MDLSVAAAARARRGHATIEHEAGEGEGDIDMNATGVQHPQQDDSDSEDVDSGAEGGAAAGASARGTSKTGSKTSSSSKSSFVSVMVVPGEDVTDKLAAVAKEARIGAGLRQIKEAIVCTKAGVLRHRKPNRFWIENSQKRYVPALEDTVIGVVVERLAESYRVDIHGTSPAMLDMLAFQGASKRNRPNLENGALVYARVVAADRDLEPELSCQVASGAGAAKDWMTGEAVFGELRGGTVLRCSLGLARQLVKPDCAVLEALGSALPFELAVGANGIIWVRAASERHTIVLCNAILNSEFLNVAETQVMVRKLLQRIAS